MKCPNCGAEGNGKFCEYCGCELPRMSPNSVTYDNSSSTTIINNIYTSSDESSSTSYPVQHFEYADPAKSDKSKTVALILCILLGVFGVHHFYVGRIKMGVLYLFTFGLFGFGWLIDIILIATGSFKDNFDLVLK